MLAFSRHYALHGRLVPYAGWRWALKSTEQREEMWGLVERDVLVSNRANDGCWLTTETDAEDVPSSIIEARGTGGLED